MIETPEKIEREIRALKSQIKKLQDRLAQLEKRLAGIGRPQGPPLHE